MIMQSRSKVMIQQQMSKCKNRTEERWNVTGLHDSIFELIRQIDGSIDIGCGARHAQ